MGGILFISFTPVARYMMYEILTNPQLETVKIAGIVNLNADRAITKANYDSYYDLAKEFDVPLHYCNDVNDKQTLDWISEKQPDLIIQSGWSQKFLPELLKMGKYGCLGEHPAPLPRGRGAACVNWAILTGETQWGDTFFVMEEKYDTGPIVGQKFFEILPHDTVETVYSKVAQSSSHIIRENILDWLSGNFKYTHQKDIPIAPTHYKRRTPKDGKLDFKQSGKQVYDAIRAQTRPYPGAFFEYMSPEHKQVKVTVWKATFDGQLAPINSLPGTLHPSLKPGTISVACGDNTLVSLERLQCERSAEQWAQEWMHTYEIEHIPC